MPVGMLGETRLHGRIEMPAELGGPGAGALACWLEGAALGAGSLDGTRLGLGMVHAGCIGRDMPGIDRLAEGGHTGVVMGRESPEGIRCADGGAVDWRATGWRTQ